MGATPVSTPLQALAFQATRGLQPIVVTNCRQDVAERNLSGAHDAPFGTLHDVPLGLNVTTTRNIIHSVNERVRGTFGSGDDAGHTVYGSLRFVPTDVAQRGAQAVIDALAAQGDVGVRAYGPVSFATDSRRLDGRWTLASDDTGATLAWPNQSTQLANVLADRLQRNDDIASSRAPRTDALLAMPRDAARDAIRQWLLSDDLGRADGYVEAQIRRLTLDDVSGVVVDRRTPHDASTRRAIDPGATPNAADAARLQARAGAANIGAVSVLSDAEQQPIGASA